ncbi:hypothetical protein [Streptomyces virginiae]|uniref:hypothetical protein n=1 Tax=Streptomyces virginiae TaxID=1961 RepID=UPI002DB6A7D2|nr:hypothetical protein [Streptomyces sp. CMAA1738]MEC4576385.1 hypothetical protein [Streptomyces sp. CMAA1738]
MIEYVLLAGGVVGVGWLVRRKHRARVGAGPVPGIPGMARMPAGQGRWRPGRVYADGGAARWVPERGEAVELPGGRATGLRVPSMKEGISINPGSRIVTCSYDGGGSIEIAVMPLDVRELLEAVPQADQTDQTDQADQAD